MGFHFRRGTGIFAKTLPFILLRLAVGAVFGLFAIIYFGALLWALFGLTDSLSWAIAVGALLVGVLVFGWIVKLLHKYVLYLVGAAHIAVIAHIVDTGEVPENQLSFGKDKVTDRFVEASALFAVDKVIKGVIKQFNKAVMSMSSLVGFVPALQNIIKVLRQAVSLAASFVDEAILAHMFLNEEQGNWSAARDAVVLYGKTWKSVLGTTILIVVAGQLLGLLAMVAMVPLVGVFSGLAPTIEFIGYAIIAGLGAILYFGLIGPWIKTIVITTFLIEARDETPDSETMDKLTSMSSRFKDLIANAEAEGPGTGPGPAGTPSDDTVGEGTPGDD